MAKYVAKSEPRSQSVAAIFESCVGGLQNDSNSKSALRRAMIRAVGERDFSSQETAQSSPHKLQFQFHNTFAHRKSEVIEKQRFRRI